MSREQQIDEQQIIQNYLETKNVHEIMHNMIEQLLINQPNDPISWMQSYFKKTNKKSIFLIGPPGLHLYSIAKNAISQKININFSTFNTGEYFTKQSNLPKEAAQKIKISRMIDDKATNKKLIKQISQFCGKQEHSLVQGFPKSLEQALFLHKQGISPDKIIFVNVSKQLLLDLCCSKIKQNNQNLSAEEIMQMSDNAATQYLLNIRDLKQYYPAYLEVNAGRQINQKDISLQIQRSLSLKFGSLQPRKNTKIVIIGAPCSGRTSLGKKIAAKYGLIYVSTAVLISQEIRKGTVIGRKLKDLFLNNQMIQSFQIEKLIEQRISKKDCQMQGFILEGYPKNKEQWENMKSLHIYPNFILGLNPPVDVLNKRGFRQQNGQFKKRYERWSRLYGEQLKQKPQIFWLDSDMSLQNYFEQACFEIQNHKL